MDISLTRSPVITATYLESHHKVGVLGGSRTFPAVLLGLALTLYSLPTEAK